MNATWAFPGLSNALTALFIPGICSYLCFSWRPGPMNRALQGLGKIALVLIVANPLLSVIDGAISFALFDNYLQQYIFTLISSVAGFLVGRKQSSLSRTLNHEKLDIFEYVVVAGLYVLCVWVTANAARNFRETLEREGATLFYVTISVYLLGLLASLFLGGVMLKALLASLGRDYVKMNPRITFTLAVLPVLGGLVACLVASEMWVGAVGQLLFVVLLFWAGKSPDTSKLTLFFGVVVGRLRPKAAASEETQ